MSHALRLTAEKIGKRIALVRPRVFARRAPIEPFLFQTLPNATAPVDAARLGERLEWDSYWAGQDVHFVLRTTFTVPDGWADPALHLPLGVSGDIFTHPEALLLIDGRAVASADRHHHLIDLDRHLADGRPHAMVLRGWTGLTGWPPDPSDRTRLFLRECAVVDLDRDLQTFVTLAETALDTARALADDRPERHGILTALDAAFLALDTRDPMGEAFRAGVAPALATLRDGLAAAGAPLDVTLHAVGHAHMDVAYLWTTDQTRQKNARTCSNVLRLMERHPEFTFSHSQPQLYAWTETDFPEIFDGIRARVAEGRWEVLGGMWVEADANMPGAEALVRQIMLARRFVESRFGTPETPVLWLPDTFGFPASLPQLMVQAGLKWFATSKLNWNQYNPMPSSTTWWEGIDGSRVLAHFLTTPRDVQHLPFPTNYKSDLTAREVLGTWTRSTTKHALRDLMICYGYGDGGGGPTGELIRRAEAYADMPGAPRVVPGTVRAFFETVEARSPELPVWSGELYMEGHRGVLTSQGWIKQANRQAEAQLHLAEFLASCALLAGAAPPPPPPPPPDLTRAWELLCTNQFHDILTGTSISPVFEDARRDFAEIAALTDDAIDTSARHLPLPGDARYLVVDPSPLPAPRLVLLPDAPGGVRDLRDGRTLPSQAMPDGLLIALPPQHGYRLTPLGAATEPAGPSATVRVTRDGDCIVLANDLIRVAVGPDGTLWRITDLIRDREVLETPGRGNRLIAFEDRPISWDAWDIDIFIGDRPEEIDAATRIEIVEEGPLRASVLVERRWRRSTIRQRIGLTHASRRIDFATGIDWRETHLLLKAAFPVAIRASCATYDIQFGHIERPTHRNTSRDAARFEVAAQKWADISEADFGVALLNDGKYGHEIHGNEMRLSLVRSPTSPDPVSDQGHHAFTYSLLPHEGCWRDHVLCEAYALNHPVRVIEPGPARAGGPDPAPPIRSLTPNAVVETVKPAEDGRGLIARIYEAHRRRGPTRYRVDPRVDRVETASLLEGPGDDLPLRDGTFSLDLGPFEIATVRLLTAGDSDAATGGVPR